MEVGSNSANFFESSSGSYHHLRRQLSDQIGADRVLRLLGVIGWFSPVEIQD